MKMKQAISTTKVGVLECPMFPEAKEATRKSFHDGTYETQNDHSKVSDQNKIADFMEKENQKSDENWSHSDENEENKLEINGKKSDKSDPNLIMESPEQEEACYEGLTLDEWYFDEFGEELKDAPWYYRQYFEQWGIYENMDFKGPWDPAYMHFLLTDESGYAIEGARIRQQTQSGEGYLQCCIQTREHEGNEKPHFGCAIACTSHHCNLLCGKQR